MASEGALPRWRFERESRTAQSEQWSIETDRYAIGRVDLHFTASRTYATLAVHHSVDEAEIEALIGAIDERLVLPADPDREDLVVTVWRGEAYGTFYEDTSSEDTSSEDTGVEASADGDA